MKSLILIAMLTFPLISNANTKAIKVSLSVVCSNSTAKELLSKAIITRLNSNKNLKITNKYPESKLFIYAQQDKNDRVNPKGWSFAVVHVSNMNSYVLASKLLKINKPAVQSLKTSFINLIKEEGFLRYMNVAHIDKLNKSTLSKIADNFVSEFVSRLRK